jgi:hypothetical protein
VDGQLEKKLKHKIDIQYMHVKVKQLALEETPKRSSNASAAPKAPKKSLTMGLNVTKDLATHNALSKKQQKENNDARATLQKDLSKGEAVEPCFCSRDAAKHFKHERRDVSVHLRGRVKSLIGFFYFFCFCFTHIYLQSFNQLVANNKQAVAASAASSQSSLGITDAMIQPSLSWTNNASRWLSDYRDRWNKVSFEQ